MIGVDEVGRGCLAGPLLVVAARATAELPPGLRDSKLMTKKQREKILNLLSICCRFGEGWASAAEIDSLGLAGALKLGVKRALENLGAETREQIIMDGSVNYVGAEFINSKCQVKADDLVPIVSAASIYAKVTRDKFMAELAKAHPDYGFDRHVGYGTKAHLLAISSHGVLNQIHRHSFAPIAKAVVG